MGVAVTPLFFLMAEEVSPSTHNLAARPVQTDLAGTSFTAAGQPVPPFQSRLLCSVPCFLGGIWNKWKEKGSPGMKATRPSVQVREVQPTVEPSLLCVLCVLRVLHVLCWGRHVGDESASE